MRLSFSPVKALMGIALALALLYVTLIAVVMNYAALTVGFAQSVRNDQAVIAVLETSYFTALHAITATNYAAAGYEKPLARTYVPSTSGTALR